MTERKSEQGKEDIIHLQKCIVAVAGPCLSGKTTLAEALASKTNMVYLDIDEARIEIYGDQLSPPMGACYERNHDHAKPYLLEGKPVILGATYSWTGYHEMLKKLAEETQTPLRVILLKTSLEEIIDRVKMRQEHRDLSDVTTAEKAIDLYQRYQPISNDPEVRVIEIDSSSSQPVEDNVNEVIAALVDLRAN